MKEIRREGLQEEALPQVTKLECLKVNKCIALLLGEEDNGL